MVEKGLEEQSNSIQERKKLAIKQNILVLSRYFTGIKSILFYAHNVCVYDFDETNRRWKRSEIEGAFHIVDTYTEIPYRIIVLNRRELENLALDLVPGWTQFEEVKGTIQLQSPQGKIYALWFFDEEEKVEAVKVLFSLLNQQKQSQGYQPVVSEFGGFSDDYLYSRKTPEKEILRLLKSPNRYNETTNDRAESSPFPPKYQQTSSPGRLGSPFPSSSVVMRELSNPSSAGYSETGRTAIVSPSSVDGGRQILSLLKHIPSSSLSETNCGVDASVGALSLKGSSFNLNSNSCEPAGATKGDSVVQMQAALDALANYSFSQKGFLQVSKIGETNRMSPSLSRRDPKDALPSSDQLKEWLNTILQDDVLFQQFYQQYIENIKSIRTKMQY